jgi:hypothetical protein
MKRLNGFSVLLIEPDLDVALALQDRLAMDGARVLTAYGVDRAMQHAETTQLSVAVVGESLCPADRKSIFHLLSKRKIPIMVNDAVNNRQNNNRQERTFITANPDEDGITAQLIEVILGQSTLLPSSATFDVPS